MKWFFKPRCSKPAGGGEYSSIYHGNHSLRPCDGLNHWGRCPLIARKGSLWLVKHWAPSVQTLVGLNQKTPPWNEIVVLWLMLLYKSVPCLCLSLTLPHPSLQLLGHVWLKPIKNYKAQWKCTPQWARQRVLSCSGQDTWTLDHKRLGGNSQQISASARNLECFILFLSHINVAFRAGQAYNIIHWKVKRETRKQHPKKRFLSLCSCAAAVCVTRLQVLQFIHSEYLKLLVTLTSFYFCKTIQYNICIRAS